MKLLALVLKNALGMWWRTLTLGFLVFAVGFVVVVFGAFTDAVRNRVASTIEDALTLDVQIRSGDSTEDDMVEHYGKGWDAIAPLSAKTVGTIEALLRREFPRVAFTATVRRSAFLEGGGKREETMLLGIDPAEFSAYREAFLLEDGRYLSPGRKGEVLLTGEQAESFHLSVGDRIGITTKNRYGLNSTLDLRVAGIGSFTVLSLFSYKACYLTTDDVRTIADFAEGEATDILISLPGSKPDGGQDQFVSRLARALGGAGVEYTVSGEEKLTSGDLMVKEFDLDGEEEDGGKVSLSTAGEMGESFRSAGGIMFVTLNVLVAFLMVIVSILIVNLVYLMGIERYREIGTMRAIGFGRRTTVALFMGEILAIAAGFGLLGILAGAGAILLFGSGGIPSPIPAMDFIMGKTLYLSVNPLSVLSGAAIILFFTTAAAFYPAYRACSIEPSRAIRSE